jgi:glycosyltransferase involved in cell wall biosynthesis
MRVFVTDLLGGNGTRDAGLPVAGSPLQTLTPNIERLLRPFFMQSAPTRSIFAVECHRILGAGTSGAVLLRLVPGENSALVLSQEFISPSDGPVGKHSYTPETLAQKAGELCALAPGNDLLVLPAPLLNEMIAPLSDNFSFRAVAALLPEQLCEADAWKLRRTLFDRGLVWIGSVDLCGSKALCFLASDAVTSLSHLNGESRGHITISALEQGGRFANQLFRYACVKLYALRHGLSAWFPAWEGKQLYGLSDLSCEGLALPKLAFSAFSEDERQLWEMDDPPINVDLAGYFQEIPECWRKHRPLLRRLFQLPPQRMRAIDAWRHNVTENGRRTLVAIHVRRGDYRNNQLFSRPWFRIVPEEWYLEWLRSVWPTLSAPLLFVSTDEPDAILPVFQEFEMVAPPAGLAELPDHVRDFEVLRRADHLAICNSSFSRMAAILAPPSQKCYLPSFNTQSFAPYEPWIDPVFWARFADSWLSPPLHGEPQHLDAPGGNGTALHGPHLQDQRHQQSAHSTSSQHAVDAPLEPATIFFDLSDLLLYMLYHTKLSGIQRVQFEIVRNLLDIAHPQPVRFAVLDNLGGLGTIEISALLDIVEDFRSGANASANIDSKVRTVLGRVVPCTVRPRDIVLTIGSFWSVKGMGILLQKLKNSGVIIGLFIHDILPIAAAEYFMTRETRKYVKGVIEALTFADFILTTSEFNKTSLLEHMASRKSDPLPVHVVPLGHELSISPPIESKISTEVAALLDQDYVLCVGTLEARKNPAYLFNMWKMMARSHRPNIPYLVFVGRKGWMVQDFLDQLEACNYLSGKILVVHDVTDAELDLLYRRCILTAYPSFVEGWGLPVGESIAHGKICLCSAAGGIPEVGGELVDYIDPYNASEGLEHLLRYLDSPELRRSREREIAEHFEPRPWRSVAEELLRSTQVLARQARQQEGVAAIMLPPNRYLSITNDASAVSMDGVDGIDGALSAELICISGWHSPEVSGVRAAQPTTVIRFRSEFAAGTRINLLVRLAASGRDFRIRARSGSGAESEVFLKDGAEGMAVLPCQVEPENLVTAYLSLVGAALDQGESSGTSHWILRGVLYFDPRCVAGEAANKMNGNSAHAPTALHPAPETLKQPDSHAHTSRQDCLLLGPADPMDDSHRAASFGAFLQTANSYWPSTFTSGRDAPIFADRADRGRFYSASVNCAHALEVGRVSDSIRVVRRSDQFVSTSRFSEGSVFDRSDASRGFGFLQLSPPGNAPWLSNRSDGLWVAESALAAAPFYEQSYLIFYNGNLHNYYHWLVEGLLPLDILSRTLGLDSHLKIALPKSVDINALIDHRDTFRAVGLNAYDIVEIEANLIKVQEAIWVDQDIVEYMPAPYLKDFQQRISALYAGLRCPRNRRLLVARKGPARTIQNLEQVQTFLARYDFETVYLEGMSMTDQILLFQSAEFVISPHGAGLANLLFCEPGTKVIELMPCFEMRPFFWLISEKLDLVHGMQFCAATPDQDFCAALTVDIGKLQALLRMVDAHL